MRNLAAGLVLALALLLGGCWDRKEIEDTAYVVSIGVDRADEREFLWTFRIVRAETLPVGMLSTAERGEDPMASEIITVRGSSLEQGIQLLQASSTRLVTLDQVRYIVFGEEMARAGLGPLVSQLLRHNEVRRNVGVAVTPGRAVDVLVQNRPVGEANPVKMMEGLLLVQRHAHLSPPVRLHHFYSRLLAPGADSLMPLIAINEMASEPPGADLPPMAGRSLQGGEFPRAGGNPVELAGTAVFRGDRLAGTLTVDETAALLALRGEMGKVYNSVPDPRDPQHQITFRIHQENKPQYRISFRGTRPVIQIKLLFEGEVLSVLGDTDYSLPPNRRALEEATARHLEGTNFKPLIAKVYGEWGADPAGLGHLYRMRFATFDDWVAYRWGDHVQEAEVTVEVELMIRRFGLLLGNPQHGGR